MSAEGLQLYALGEQAWARREIEQAAQLLEKACTFLPTHGAAHHVWGKAMAELGDCHRAEALQQRSCNLDPGLAWNWFALHLDDGSELMVYELFDVNGALVGGASLKAADFAPIVAALAAS